MHASATQYVRVILRSVKLLSIFIRTGAAYKALTAACIAGKFVVSNGALLQEPPDDVRSSDSALWKEAIMAIDRRLDIGMCVN